MIKTADYIYDNILIADGKNSTLDYCKKTTGVDLSVKNFYSVITPGRILKKGTKVGTYQPLSKKEYSVDSDTFTGWFLPKGDYICELNEGCKFGPSDVGYIVLRSSLNRNGVSLTSAVWDPGFTTKNDKGEISSMSVRLTVNTDQGVYIEENARVGQLMVFDADKDVEQYSAVGHQFQGTGLF